MRHITYLSQGEGGGGDTLRGEQADRCAHSYTQISMIERRLIQSPRARSLKQQKFADDLNGRSQTWSRVENRDDGDKGVRGIVAWVITAHIKKVA